MNIGLLTISIESVYRTDDCVKAKVVACGTKGEPIPLNAIAFGRTADRLATTPVNTSITIKAQLQPGDKFKPMLVKVLAVMGGESEPQAVSAPPAARPSPAPTPTSPATLSPEDLDGIPF